MRGLTAARRMMQEPIDLFATTAPSEGLPRRWCKAVSPTVSPRFACPALRASLGIPSDRRATLAVRQLSVPDLADGGDSTAQHENAPNRLVLGSLSGRDG